MKNRIKYLRNERNLTMRDLSEKVGVSSAYISDVENGVIKNPSKDRLERIAKVLDVPLEELFESSEKLIHNESGIGSKLKRIRKSMNMTQEEFVELIGISKTALQRYELGLRVPSRDRIISISNKLSIPLDVLLKEENDKDVELPEVIEDLINFRMKEIFNSNEHLDVIYNKGFIDGLKTVLSVIDKFNNKN